jgi:hypothetical protein
MLQPSLLLPLRRPLVALAQFAPVALRHTSPSMVLTASASYMFSRTLFFRWIGGVFIVANLIALRQNRALIGGSGLLPVDSYLRDTASPEGTAASFWRKPSAFWLLARRAKPPCAAVDRWLDAHAIGGLVLAAPLLLFGVGSCVQLLALWALYTSLSNVGQRFYAFGWEVCARPTWPCTVPER